MPTAPEFAESYSLLACIARCAFASFVNEIISIDCERQRRSGYACFANHQLHLSDVLDVSDRLVSQLDFAHSSHVSGILRAEPDEGEAREWPSSGKAGLGVADIIGKSSEWGWLLSSSSERAGDGGRRHHHRVKL